MSRCMRVYHFDMQQNYVNNLITLTCQSDMLTYYLFMLTGKVCNINIFKLHVNTLMLHFDIYIYVTYLHNQLSSRGRNMSP